MKTAIMPIVILLNAIMLSVTMLRVIIPFYEWAVSNMDP